MLMLTNPNALFWLLIEFSIAGLIAYTVLFPLVYLRLCKLPPSIAIRYAWTAGLWSLLLYVTLLSPHHADYLYFWQGDMMALLNFLILVALFGGLLAYFWFKCPRLRS